MLNSDKTCVLASSKARNHAAVRARRTRHRGDHSRSPRRYVQSDRAKTNDGGTATNVLTSWMVSAGTGSTRHSTARAREIRERSFPMVAGIRSLRTFRPTRRRYGECRSPRTAVGGREVQAIASFPRFRLPIRSLATQSGRRWRTACGTFTFKRIRVMGAPSLQIASLPISQGKENQ